MKKGNYQMAAIFAFLVITFFSFNGVARAESADISQTTDNGAIGFYKDECLYQSFTPTQSNITGVDVKLHSYNVLGSVKVGVTATLGAGTGEVTPEFLAFAASSTFQVQTPGTVQHYTFSHSLTPSSTYYIKVCNTIASDPGGNFGLYVRKSNANPYAGGQVWAQGSLYAGDDIYFTTYYDSTPPPDPTPTTTPATTTPGVINMTKIMATLIYFITLVFTLLWPIVLVIGITAGFIAAAMRLFNFKINK